MKLNNKQTKLLDFVKEKHSNQKRKYTGEPYWFHLLSVANITNEKVPFAIEISLCHDLIEDTPTTRQDIRDFLESIGYNKTEVEYICDGVVALTDVYVKEKYPELNRAQRKKLEAERLSSIKPEYQTIKYGDIIDNTTSIVKYDPHFAKVYLKEKTAILTIMKDGNEELYQKALTQIQ